MTYLETLIRILPRQRRAFESQKNRGLGMFFFGTAVAAGQCINMAIHGFNYWALFGLIISGYLILFGGYRLTRADLMLAKVDADMRSVGIALVRNDGISDVPEAPFHEFHDELDRIVPPMPHQRRARP
jgi:hypothetical protein